jgi:hypothetical protein
MYITLLIGSCVIKWVVCMGCFDVGEKMMQWKTVLRSKVSVDCDKWSFKCRHWPCDLAKHSEKCIGRSMYEENKDQRSFLEANYQLKQAFTLGFNKALRKYC